MKSIPNIMYAQATWRVSIPSEIGGVPNPESGLALYFGDMSEYGFSSPQDEGQDWFHEPP